MSSPIPLTPSNTQHALNVINDNEAHRRAARAAEAATLNAGGTPEQAMLAFTQAMQDAPPPAARAYVQQTIQMLNVSPEGFMALLQSQVAREDEKVLESRNAIETAIAQSRAISERMEALQCIHQMISQQPDADRDISNADAVVTINGRMMTLAEAIEAHDLFDELNLRPRRDDGELWHTGLNLKAEAVQSAVDVLRTEQQAVTSDNELNMITMQQAMQQRGQHLQLVSKVLAMFSETDRAIVGNMR
jgi:hypothetical protein